MSRSWGVLICCLSLLGAAALPAAAEGRQDGGRILDYVARAEIGTDGSLSITEQIQYRFGTDGHGDFRVVPRHYMLEPPPDRIDHMRVVDIDFQSATMDGQPVPFGVERPEPAMAVLRVGEPSDTMIGEHEFELSYRIQGLVVNEDGRRRLDWYVNGDAQVPIDHAALTLTAPGRVRDIWCYSAPNDVDPRSLCSTIDEDGDTARFATDTIRGDEALRITAEMPDSVAVVKQKSEALPDFTNGHPPSSGNSLFGAGTAGWVIVLFVIGVVGFGLARRVLHFVRDHRADE